MTTSTLLPTPIPPVSFAQLNAARAHALRASQAARHRASVNRAGVKRLQASAAKAPLLGTSSAPRQPPAPAKSHPLLWVPATLIAGFFLYTFFSKKSAERSAKRREAGARLFSRTHKTPEK